MLLTEEQAQQKWCPFATTTAVSIAAPGGKTTSGIYDTRGKSKGFTSCLASDCMAWRWVNPNTSPLGFCGLAGMPEE